MFYQIFLSPQVKQRAIITYKHKLPNNLRLKDLRKLGIIRKVSKPHRLIAQRPAPWQNEVFDNTSKKLLKNRK